MTLSEELQWRGFIYQTTYEDITELDKSPITFYWGVDPSAASMTIGNLAAAMMVYHFIKYGHKAVLLVGGATGIIGDPDGKAEERPLKTLEEIAKNKEGIATQYQNLYGNGGFTLVDNYDWFKDFGYLQFLREVGKHVPVRQMLGRDFVQKRLGADGAGISYAEFSYVLIQAYDFVHLNKEYGVTLQLCGSDQWGNSIAGVDLTRRLTGNETHVWSTPLVINKATGKKFGKSEDGAIWLDEELTSPYRFYQFWLNVDDEGAGDYLKIYTLLSKEDHEKIMSEFEQNRAGRLAQRTLAYEVTKLIHGQEKADSVKRISEVLFGGGDYTSLVTEDFEGMIKELPYVQGHIGDGLTEPLVQAGLATSNSEARRFLEQGAVYINGVQVGAATTIETKDRLGGSYAVLRRGKNSNAILKISD